MKRRDYDLPMQRLWFHLHVCLGFSLKDPVSDFIPGPLIYDIYLCVDCRCNMFICVASAICWIYANLVHLSEFQQIQREQPLALPRKPPQSRNFWGSTVAPFAGNNILVLHSCPVNNSIKYFVQVLHNEHPIPMPVCFVVHLPIITCFCALIWFLFLLISDFFLYKPFRCLSFVFLWIGL